MQIQNTLAINASGKPGNNVTICQGALLTQVFKLTIISINLIAFVLSYICLLMHQDRLNLSN